jgi:hypothetical protein
VERIVGRGLGVEQLQILLEFKVVLKDGFDTLHFTPVHRSLPLIFTVAFLFLLLPCGPVILFLSLVLPFMILFTHGRLCALY